MHEPGDVDAKLILEHREHGRHPASDGPHHFSDTVGPTRAIAHLDDVDLVDAGELGRECLGELGHFFDHHVDDGGFVEVLPGFRLALQALGFGEQLLLDDFGLGFTDRKNLCRFCSTNALDL